MNKHFNENEWLERFREAKDLVECQKLINELQEALSDEKLRWCLLYACLHHFVELETKPFERQVYEYCLAVFKMFEPGLSAVRERELNDELERRMCVVSALYALEIDMLSGSEKEFLELVKGGKISEDDLLRHSSELKSARAWAVLNFFLYSALYAQKYGKIPGGGLAISIGVAVGALGRLCRCCSPGL